MAEASCLADMPVDALATLAEAEGFAGQVTLEADHCTWHREVNWHGPPDRPDVGEISFDEQGRMIESGVLADYTELWEQSAEGAGRAIRFAGGGYAGTFVTWDTVGVIGIDQSGKASCQSLLDARIATQNSDDLERLFDGLYALCRVDGRHVIADLATQPFAEGHPILTMVDDALVWHKVGFYGDMFDVVMSIELQVR